MPFESEDSRVAEAVRRLQTTRFVRSVGQGALYVLFTLYMKDLGWSAAALGVLFSAGGLFSSSVGWFVGLACDRMGRKLFMLIYEGLIFAGGLFFVFTDNPYLLAAASFLLGFGRSQGGAPDSASAAEQAWLAEGVPVKQRGSAFSQNSALGFTGMGVGCLLAGIVPWIEAFLPGTLVYRPFFLLAAVTAAFNFAALRGATEFYRGVAQRGGSTREGAAATGAPERAREETQTLVERLAGPQATPEEIRRRENGIMIRMAAVNALNGVAIGLTGPLLVYWFNLKFGVGPGSLGPVYAATFIITGMASVWTGRLTERVGIVRAVVTVRMASVVALLLVPLMPTFTLASIVHILRSALARGSIGARRALAVNLVRDERRGFASGVNNISSQLPQAVGPSIAGWFIASGQMAMPFILGAVMQFLYGTFYGAAFRRYDVTDRDEARNRRREDRTGPPVASNS